MVLQTLGNTMTSNVELLINFRRILIKRAACRFPRNGKVAVRNPLAAGFMFGYAHFLGAWHTFRRTSNDERRMKGN